MTCVLRSHCLDKAPCACIPKEKKSTQVCIHFVDNTVIIIIIIYSVLYLNKF